MKKSFFAIATLMLLLGTPLQALAASTLDSHQAEGVYHGISESGMTGLGNTVSPYSIGTGISASVNQFSQPTIAGTATIVMPAVTLGLGKNIEIAARTGLFSQPGLTETTDTEVYFKYNFRSLGESMPAMAIAFGAVLPTASNPVVSDVTTIGGRIIVIAGGEAQVTEEMVIGTYLNVGANFMDPGQATQYSYLSGNLGLMVPISDDKKLQGFLEAHATDGKPTVTPLSGGTTPKYRIGMRYAGRFLKFTLGVESGWTTPAIAGGVTFEI